MKDGVQQGLAGVALGHRRGKVRQRFGHAEEHEAHAHAGGEQHGQPGEKGKFRLLLIGPQLDIAEAADGQRQ